MGTIKFRAKGIDRDFSNQWIYGSLILDLDTFICDHTIPTDPELALIRVDKKTVGQFTGLQDKNGKDIYKGDLLNTKTTFRNNMADKRFQKNTIIEVGFKDGCFIDKNTDVNLFDKIFSPVSRKIDFEIIGNIHENPELLK